MPKGRHLCRLCLDENPVKIRNHLQKHHSSISYRDYVLNYLDSSGGFCGSCRKETEINWKAGKFHKTCGQSSCLKNRFTESSREYQTKRWGDDKIYREKMKSVSSKTMKILMKKESFKGKDYVFTSERLKEFWTDEGYREQQSIRATLQNKNPSSNFGKPYSGWCSYNGVNFRSSWEKKFAQDLDSIGVSWEYEQYEFSYINFQGKKSRYLVDFFLPTFQIFVEIKAQYFFDENTELKIRCVENQGHQILLLKNNNYSEILERIQSLCQYT